MPDMIELRTALIHQCGAARYKTLLETSADQVKTRDGSDIETRLKLIERALAGLATTHIVGDIAGRDKLPANPGDHAVVIDASGDETVDKGGATYVKLAGGGWLKTGESESLDRLLKWAELQGRPRSEPAAIDNAAAMAHRHGNAEALAGLEDIGGRLGYKGRPVYPGKKWIAKAESVDALNFGDLADGALVILQEPPSCDCECEGCEPAKPGEARAYLHIGGQLEPLDIMGSGGGGGISISASAFSINSGGMLCVDESQAGGLKFNISDSGYLEAVNG